MKSLKEFLLIFAVTGLILIAGVYFGFAQINNPYEISENTLLLAEPFKGSVDRDFLRTLDPAL